MFGGRVPASHILRIPLDHCAGSAAHRGDGGRLSRAPRHLPSPSRAAPRLDATRGSRALPHEEHRPTRRSAGARSTDPLLNQHRRPTRHTLARRLSAAPAPPRTSGRRVVRPRVGRRGCGPMTRTASRCVDRRRSRRSRGVGCPEDRSRAIQPDHRRSASRPFDIPPRAGRVDPRPRSSHSSLSASRRPAPHRRAAPRPA